MNQTPTQSVSWLNNKLKVMESSKSGQGTFASEDINEGEILVIQGGKIISIEEIEANNANEMSHAYHGFQVHQRFYIYPLQDSDGVHLDGIFNINHSCNPNAGFKDSITLVSMRDIPAGEEICYDYAMTDMELPDEEPWEVYTCNCQSTECREKITGSDWMKPELQQRYVGYFSPYLAAVIKQHKN